MRKRLTKKLADVIADVERDLIAHHGVTKHQLLQWKRRAQASKYKFPLCHQVTVAELHIDYEVQRDVICKHIVSIMKKWDPRVCSPAAGCKITDSGAIFVYDGQHRVIAAALLGYTSVPCSIVETDDPNFASYAFELLNDTGIKRLTPGDLHRNALVRYKNGSRELRNVEARTLQDQFDALEIDLEDKKSRNNPNLCGTNDYFFSHFKYAKKPIECDKSGKSLHAILHAIKTVFPLQEEIDQGVFIGLHELQRLIGTNPNAVKLPKDWMVVLLGSVKTVFKTSHTVHNKAKVQWEHSHPGAGWNAPLAMSNFLREVHTHVGGKLNLPFHGEGSKVGIEDGNIAPGLFPETVAQGQAA